MLEDPIMVKQELEELERKAREWPMEKFLERIESLVEHSRLHIESSEDEQTRASLISFYQGIIRFAFACQIKALSMQTPAGLVETEIIASC